MWFICNIKNNDISSAFAITQVFRNYRQVLNGILERTDVFDDQLNHFLEQKMTLLRQFLVVVNLHHRHHHP